MFIAEVSSNHNRNLDRCLDFVTKAQQSGFDAVKFQVFKIDQLFTPEVLQRSKMHSDRKEWEFPIEFLPAISERCKKLGIKLGITPFYLDAVDECKEYVDFFKVASYELLWTDLHERIISENKEVIISTGMATIEEVKLVKKLYDRLNFDYKKLTILHCESQYPTSYKTVNLGAIRTMRNELGCAIGWSDHSKDVDVICAAKFIYGCDLFELHFDLDGQGEEAKGGHCWLPNEMELLNSKMSKISAMRGSGIKEPSNNETQERLWRADPVDGLRPRISIRKKLDL